MTTDVSVIVADLKRLGSIKSSVRPSGRTLYFSSGNLVAAMESIRSLRPKLIAIDALFATTSPGAAFLERVENAAVAGSRITLMVEHDGKWFGAPTVSAALRASAASVAVAAPPLPVAAPPSPAPVVPAPAIAGIATQIARPGTRRAPRFAVKKRISAGLDDGRASLVDISVLGAQLMSLPTLRPNQRIALELPDTATMLTLVAEVAWATYERPSSDVEPYYRAGIEFTRPAQDALEDYRQRHCISQPTS
jgi:hypothetical protein